MTTSWKKTWSSSERNAGVWEDIIAEFSVGPVDVHRRVGSLLDRS